MRGIALTIELTNKIQNLRKKGFSYSEISKKLNIPQTTVRNYAYSIKIESKFLEIWKSKRGGSAQLKLQKESKILEWAKKTIYDISTNEIMLFISALYWGEGSKRDLEIINSNPYLLCVFAEGLRKTFGVTNDRIKIMIRLFPGLNKDSCIKFWCQTLNIPTENVVGFEHVTGRSAKAGKLPYGMCRVRIRKGEYILKQIHAINVVVTNKIISKRPRSSMDRADAS